MTMEEPGMYGFDVTERGICDVPFLENDTESSFSHVPPLSTPGFRETIAF